MNEEKLKELLEELKQEDLIIAYCCCGNKRTSSTHC